MDIILTLRATSATGGPVGEWDLYPMNENGTIHLYLWVLIGAWIFGYFLL